MADPIPDDGSPGRDGHAASGAAQARAAILLVESLIHGLVARDLIKLEDAVDMVGDALDVSEDLAREASECPANQSETVRILHAIRSSLSIDLPLEDKRPWPPGK